VVELQEFDRLLELWRDDQPVFEAQGLAVFQSDADAVHPGPPAFVQRGVGLRADGLPSEGGIVLRS
jgi:hypothetical protein